MGWLENTIFKNLADYPHSFRVRSAIVLLRQDTDWSDTCLFSLLFSSALQTGLFGAIKSFGVYAWERYPVRFSNTTKLLCSSLRTVNLYTRERYLVCFFNRPHNSSLNCDPTSGSDTWCVFKAKLLQILVDTAKWLGPPPPPPPTHLAVMPGGHKRIPTSSRIQIRSSILSRPSANGKGRRAPTRSTSQVHRSRSLSEPNERVTLHEISSENTSKTLPRLSASLSPGTTSAIHQHEVRSSRAARSSETDPRPRISSS